MLDDKTKWQGDGPCYLDMRRETAPRCVSTKASRRGLADFALVKKTERQVKLEIRQTTPPSLSGELYGCRRARGTRIALLELSDDGVVIYCGAHSGAFNPLFLRYRLHGMEVVPLMLEVPVV